MNEQQLKCFVKTAERLSFTQAARELYLSVPTVTHHIQSLEKELNVKLLDRNRQSVHMTAAGEAFYRDASDLLIRMEEAERHASDAGNSSHFLRIGCTSEMEILHLAGMLAKLHLKAGSLKPQFTVNDYAHIVSSLKEHQIDIAFGTKEMFPQDSSITFKSLSEERSCVLMKRKAPVPKEISFESLEEERLITLSTRMIPFHYGDKVQALIQRHQQAHDDLYVDTGVQALALVKAGYGAAVMPGFMMPELSGDAASARIMESDHLSYGMAYSRKNISASVKACMMILKQKDA